MKNENSKSDSKNKITASQIAVFTGTFIAVTIAIVTANGGLKKNQKLHKLLIKGAKEINMNTPQFLDAHTRLDSASVVADSILRDNYTLTNYEKYEINKDTADKYLKANTIEQVKTSPEMRILRERKVTFSYYYRDKNGELAYDFEVIPSLYEE